MESTSLHGNGQEALVSDRIAALESQIREHQAAISTLSAQISALRTPPPATLISTATTSNVTVPTALAPDTPSTSPLVPGIPTTTPSPVAPRTLTPSPPSAASRFPLTQPEYTRYSRHLILPTIGLSGHLAIRAASILIIGAGGLGCPAAAYLAGAGIGRIGIVDGDAVELGNLQRQIMYTTADIGVSKARALVGRLRQLNPLPAYTAYETFLDAENALGIVRGYDLVLDCTDSPASRYLVSDACILAGKTLVSAAALGTHGQLVVLNSPPAPAGETRGGACYRCVFPTPPPAASVKSCGEAGVLGPVVGVVGVLAALEGIRVLVQGRHVPLTECGTGAGGVNGVDAKQKSATPLKIFDGWPAGDSGVPGGVYRDVRLRGRRPSCPACGTPGIGRTSLDERDYTSLCGTPFEETLNAEQRVSALDMSLSLASGTGIVIDVRPAAEFALGSIVGSVNVPIEEIERAVARDAAAAAKAARSAAPSTSAATSSVGPVSGDVFSSTLADTLARASTSAPPDAPLYFICKRGNDSQTAVHALQTLNLVPDAGDRWVGDVRGGLVSWRKDVEHNFPDY